MNSFNLSRKKLSLPWGTLLAGWVMTCLLSSRLVAQNEVVVGGFVPAPIYSQAAVPLQTYAPRLAGPAVVSASAVAPSISSVESQLRTTLKRAMDGLDETTLPDLEETRQRLQQAIEVAERYIGAGTANGDRWSKFLRLDEIREQANAERPSAATLAELELNMQQNYSGLASPALLGLRDALNGFKRAVRYGGDPERTIGVLSRRIEQLLESLDGEASEAERSQDLGRVLNYLYESEQAPWAVSELRALYSRPNIQISAEERFLNRVLSQAVAKPSPVDECILGTRVLGQACLRGNVSADIMPMHGGVSLQLNLTGSITSRNRGYNRGVVLGTTSYSPVSASKYISLTPQSISSSPAQVGTSLTTRINSISHKLRLVRKIASKKAAEQKPQADAISEQRMRNKLQRQYDSQVETQLTQARTRLSEARSNAQNRSELRRFNIPQPSLAVYSTDRSVHGNVVQAAAYQLAADSSCNIARPADLDVVVEVHQSLAINTLETLLAERTVHHHDIDDFAKQLLGKVPEDLEEQEPFTITMTAYNPVHFEFDDDQIKMTLRFTRMVGADRNISNAVVQVAYAPTLSNGVLTLNRQGEVVVDLPTVRSAMQRTSQKSAVKAKLEPIFKEQIVFDQVNFNRWFPKAPPIDLSWLKVDGGWLQIGAK